MKKNERKQIINLLAEGHIDAETAEKLLDALDFSENVIPERKQNSFKNIKIMISEPDDEKVEITIPLEFANLFKNNKNYGNVTINSNLDAHNIDIESIIEMASSGAIGEILNIKESDGTTIVIKIE